ncbi:MULTISPECIES: hypothetical protein [unclassified Mesorhizobium]|uniref:hypothetical protein n=1 Tax=unclassified Mesorhizobium TaxID=325217 RepID=UPI001129C064|nr:MULTISPECIES: hypothetical protein [unclassified Mesorhizobium]TPK42287.1 hypothetical protein FJ550_30085 [Mesorhizobium sp. B2-5-2]TPL44518.1 hypothetical protein FJ961_04055 [Mesorhizobium sp. B2-4-5]TPM68705.1 hypothetical protein FJ968_29860 [Mesorhizobium sp. B2-1-6]TPN71735.1 hypothetical protein FJ985_30590 [Mesorhizobium sp. B1-1-2]
MRDLVATDDFDKLPEKYRDRARAIKARVAEIGELMKPCDAADTRAAVLRMAGQFRDQPEIDHAEMAGQFLAACRDLPAWAVSEAASDFLAGRVDNHTGQFMPTCAEFAKRARAIMTPFLSERAALRTEASKLIDRAREDHKRHLIEMERQDPAVRKRVAALAEAATAGAAKRQGLPRIAMNQAEQKRIDALKRPRQDISKLEQTKIVKGRS